MNWSDWTDLMNWSDWTDLMNWSEWPDLMNWSEWTDLKDWPDWTDLMNWSDKRHSMDLTDNWVSVSEMRDRNILLNCAVFCLFWPMAAIKGTIAKTMVCACLSLYLLSRVLTLAGSGLVRSMREWRLIYSQLNTARGGEHRGSLHSGGGTQVAGTGHR